MVGPNPEQLMALMYIQLWKHWLVPPELLAVVAATATATTGGVGSGSGGGGALAGVDLEALIRGNKGGVGPICLNSAALCGPIICVPNRAVNSHGLVSRKWHTLVFHIRVGSNWGFVHKKSTQIRRNFYETILNTWKWLRTNLEDDHKFINRNNFYQ